MYEQRLIRIRSPSFWVEHKKVVLSIYISTCILYFTVFRYHTHTKLQSNLYHTHNYSQTYINTQSNSPAGAAQTRPQPLLQHFMSPSQSPSLWHSSTHTPAESSLNAGHWPCLVITENKIVNIVCALYSISLIKANQPNTMILIERVRFVDTGYNFKNCIIVL